MPQTFQICLNDIPFYLEMKFEIFVQSSKFLFIFSLMNFQEFSLFSYLAGHAGGPLLVPFLATEI